MKIKTIIFVITILLILSCKEEKTTFDNVALNETFVQKNGEKIQFKDILKKNEGKTIFIDIWASWCSDCVAGIPEFKKLQAEEKEVTYVMLSLDKTEDLWEAGIKKHKLEAQHYLFTKKWKESGFCKSIDLDWIPRYMIVGKDGAIKMYKAIKLEDKAIKNTIKEDK